MMDSSKQPNLHRGKFAMTTFFTPQTPLKGGKRKQHISLPFQELLQWEWEEVSMMAFKQRFNSLLLQRRRQQRSTNNNEFLHLAT
jgi:hypothetical protein